MAELILKESRKTFAGGYLLVLLLTAWIVVLKQRGVVIEAPALTLSAIVVAGGLLLPEVARSWQTCVVKKNKIELTSGVIRKRHRKFFTNTVTDIHVRQNLWQRLLNYGTIKVSSFSQHGEIRLGNVDNPHDCVVQIEKIIEVEKKRDAET
jgi:uncharacterized membrane protein YdbT with pleckstrin-like domain